MFQQYSCKHLVKYHKIPDARSEGQETHLAEPDKKRDRYKGRMSITGSRIRDARESTRTSQTELAAQVNRSLGWMSDIERGKNSIDAHDLYRLSRILGYPMEWFVDPNYDHRPLVGPLTRIEWEKMYTSRERAEAHWLLDEIFRKALERVEEYAETGEPHS